MNGRKWAWHMQRQGLRGENGCYLKDTEGDTDLQYLKVYD